MARPIVYLAGKDPLEELGGGHSSYVRTHARAALRLGFEPHLFGISQSSGVCETDYGVVHRLYSPFHHRPGGLRAYTAVWHMPLLVAGVRRYLAGNPGVRLLHGFSIWGSAGISLRRSHQRGGPDLTVIASAYTTLRHEQQGKLRGIGRVHGQAKRLRALVEAHWMEVAIARYERRAYLGADLMLINYESVRQMLHAQFGPAVRCRRLPYASEAAFLHEPAPLQIAPPADLTALLPADAPLIVSVSRHDPRKGVDVLLRALAALRQTGQRFRACLLGSGWLLEPHRRLAEKLGLRDIVLMPGFVPDAFVYLRHADLFVLPSLEEGSGSLSLIEALQAGVPVIASHLDGIPEDVTDGESALLIAPGDADALCQALQRVLSDAALRARLARGARLTFTEKFSAAAFTESLRQVYAELGFEGGSTL